MAEQTTVGPKIIVVGAVAGGMSAATRLRRNLDNADIVVLERGSHVSFANCGLPYHVGGVIEQRSDLLLNTVESLAARFRLEIRVRHEVVRIETERRVVVVRDLGSGRITEEGYDHLVLSSGAAGRSLPFPSDQPAYGLHDMDDLDALVAALPREGHAVVIGAGYIGLEIAENLRMRGIATTVVTRGDRLLRGFDEEMVAPLKRLLVQDFGLRSGVGVECVAGGELCLDDGTKLPVDLLINATGVTPRSELAFQCGVECGPNGGIVVDDRQQTSVAGIWAVGDVALKRDSVSGALELVTLAGPANREGRLVADAISGIDRHSPVSPGTAIVGFCGLVAARTGQSETVLRAAGRRHRVIHTHPTQHAGYYPAAERMAMKLMVDAETDAILGAQIVGGEGVDKRIDVIVAAMAGGLTASDLADLDLAYAPQFGSAKDPINLLGYIAGNQARGEDPTVQWHELAGRLSDGWLLVDVRPSEIHAAAGIPGSVSIPLPELRERVDELRGRRVVVHCGVGQTSHTAQRLLLQHGIEAENLDGGYSTWNDATGHGLTAALQLAAVAP